MGWLGMALSVGGPSNRFSLRGLVTHQANRLVPGRTATMRSCCRQIGTDSEVSPVFRNREEHRADHTALVICQIRHYTPLSEM